MIKSAGSERGVIVGLLRYPQLVYEFLPFLNENFFVTEAHRALYLITKSLVVDDGARKVDKTSVIAKADVLGIKNFAKITSDYTYVDALIDSNIDINNARTCCGQIRKAYTIRELRDILRGGASRLETNDYDVALQNAHDVIYKVEQEIFEGIGKIRQETTIESIGSSIDEVVKDTIEKGDQRIITTGFAQWDLALGGGLRKPSIHVVAARPKNRKTTFVSNVALNVAGRGIPVLYIDTELTKTQMSIILLSTMTGIAQKDIELGFWKNSENAAMRIDEAKASLKKMPLYYVSGVGKPIEEVIGHIRRFLHKDVGVDDHGKAKDCLVIYDFLHLGDLRGISNAIREYQVLGLYMTMFRNITVKYEVPLLLVAQLNRQGTEFDEGVVSGSDRIEWFCTSLNVLRKKLNDEMEKDGATNGNLKLHSSFVRMGPGHQDNEYLNLIVDNPTGKITEGRTNIEIYKEQKQHQEANDDNSSEKPNRHSRRTKACPE